MPEQPNRPAAPSSALGVVTIVMTLVGWSSVPLFLKHFSHVIDLWTSNGWRYAFSALLWAPVLVVGVWRRRLPRGLWAAAAVPAVFNTLGQVAFTWAHYKIDPGLLTFGLRTQIIFVALGAYVLFPSERAVLGSRAYKAGFVMVLGGAMATIFLGEKPVLGAQAWGIALAIASGAMFAAYALSVRGYMKGFSPVVAFAAISQYTAAAMVGLMLGLGERSGARAWALPDGQLALLLLSAVIGIALGHVFYYISIARLGVAISSGVVQLQPILVTAASYVLFGERMTGRQLAGGAVAIGGAVLMLSVQGRLGREQRPIGNAAQRHIEEDAELMATETGAEGVVVGEGGNDQMAKGQTTR